MSNPTDKASVADRLMQLCHPDAEWMSDRDRITAFVNVGVEAVGRIMDLEAALSPAQGDGMRDALVKARMLLEAMYADQGVAHEQFDRLTTVRQIDAALASHPDRQPGMTDEEILAAAIRIREAAQEECRRARFVGDGKGANWTAVEVLAIHELSEMAAIKRASQRQ